jgi:SAM-dependent methyltransferase
MQNIYQKFAKYYDQVYDTFYDYNWECGQIEILFNELLKSPPKDILDIGCGTGTHAIELTKRGYRVTGIDFSKPMIKQARRKAQDEEVEIDFQVMDMRVMEFNSKFDAAVCLFGVYDYLIEEEDVNRFFHSLKAALKKNSLFIFEFWNKEEVQNGYRNWVKSKDKSKGTTLIRLAESRFNPKTNTSTVKMEFLSFDKSKVLDSFVETHKLKSYSVSEIEEILSDNGFNLLRYYGKDIKTKRLNLSSTGLFNIIAVANKI